MTRLVWWVSKKISLLIYPYELLSLQLVTALLECIDQVLALAINILQILTKISKAAGVYYYYSMLDKGLYV